MFAVDGLLLFLQVVAQDLFDRPPDGLTGGAGGQHNNQRPDQYGRGGIADIQPRDYRGRKCQQPDLCSDASFHVVTSVFPIGRFHAALDEALIERFDPGRAAYDWPARPAAGRAASRQVQTGAALTASSGLSAAACAATRTRVA